MIPTRSVSKVNLSPARPPFSARPRAMVRGCLGLIIFVLFGATLCRAQSTYTAASANYADVNAVINGPTHVAVNGDVIQIPCTGTQSVVWTNALQVSASITITALGATPNTGASTFGAGTNCLTIRDDAVSAGLFVFRPTYAATNNVTTLQNINIDPFSTSTSLCDPIFIIGVATSSGFPQARIDNIGFGITTPWSEGGNSSCSSAMIVQDDVIGVADHNTLPSATGFGTELMDGNFSAYLGVGQYGDNSWAQPDSMGGPINWFNENNVMYIATDMVDCEKSDTFTDTGGCRYVNRYNHVYMPNGGFQISGVHGLDTGGRFRAGRHTETYGNLLICGNVTTQVACNDFASMRGGTGMVWGNTATSTGGGFFSGVADITIYRVVFGPGPWGYCGGLNSQDPYDTNDNAVYLSGTMSTTGSGVLTMIDSTKSFGNLDPAGAPYSVYDVTQGFYSEVQSNTSTTITVKSPISESGWTGFNSGDSYEIVRSTICQDQGGRGAGVYISGTTPTPSGPINQVLDPVYEWGNTMPSNAVSYNFGAYSLRTLQNRDFYTENRKGQPVQQTSPTTPWNGSAVQGSGQGVGWGTLANRPTTCTPGVGYFATDQGNWNQSGSDAQGELFVCSAGNTWTLHYEPYTYPHPLTTGTVTTGNLPQPPTNLTATVD